MALLLTGLLISAAVPAAEGPTVPYLGRPVADVIDEFRAEDVPFAYSTGLIGADLLVLKEPTRNEPVALVNEILEPHGLTLRTIAGVHLVVRIDRTDSTPEETTVISGGQPDKDAGIEMIVVSASRYEISRDIASSRFKLDQRSIQTMPDVGEDPIRIVQRLPGAAASGASARSHFRGAQRGSHHPRD